MRSTHCATRRTNDASLPSHRRQSLLVCAARRYHPDVNSGCAQAATQFVRVKEAYDSVLREALQFEQNTQERGHAAADGAQHPGGRYERPRAYPTLPPALPLPLPLTLPLTLTLTLTLTLSRRRP